MPVFKRVKDRGVAGPAFPSGKLDTGDASAFVPSLAEADDTYGALVARRGELNDKLRDATAAQREADAALAADSGSGVRAGVAELLGDEAEGSRRAKAEALRKARQQVADIDDALTIVGQRLRDAHVAASRAACAKVRPEFSKRVKALAKALIAADEAHRALDDLFLALESEDIATGTLGQVRPYFLGGARDQQRRIATYLKEVAEAGYGD